MLKCSALAGSRVLVVLVELGIVGLVVTADLSGGQTARRRSGKEGSCARGAGGGGGSPRNLPEQAGLEHCGCVVVVLV